MRGYVRADNLVAPELKKVKFEKIPEPTQEELVAAYDANVKKQQAEIRENHAKAREADTPREDLTRVSQNEFINALARA